METVIIHRKNDQQLSALKALRLSPIVSFYFFRVTDSSEKPENAVRTCNEERGPQATPSSFSRTLAGESSFQLLKATIKACPLPNR